MSIDDAYHQFSTIVECDWPMELRGYNNPSAIERRRDYMVRLCDAFQVYLCTLAKDTGQHCHLQPDLIGSIQAHMQDMTADVRGIPT